MSPNNSIRAIAKNAHVILHQKDLILKAISNNDYIRKHPQFRGGSVGGHIRHSLDHFSKIIFCTPNSLVVPVIDYDTRERNTEIETNCTIALKQVQRLLVEIENVSKLKSDLPIVIEHICDSHTGVRQQMVSTFGRELMFVSHHALHHMFTVRLMMEAMSYSLNISDIGIANSTIRYESDN